MNDKLFNQFCQDARFCEAMASKEHPDGGYYIRHHGVFISAYDTEELFRLYEQEVARQAHKKILVKV